jgi:hypothetical protein
MWPSVREHHQKWKFITIVRGHKNIEFSFWTWRLSYTLLRASPKEIGEFEMAVIQLYKTEPFSPGQGGQNTFF